MRKVKRDKGAKFFAPPLLSPVGVEILPVVTLALAKRAQFGKARAYLGEFRYE